MTETPRDPFVPDPTPDPAPDPVPPPYDPPPLEPVTPPEPIEPISPPEPGEPITPPDPAEIPPPLGSGAPEPPSAYENAGDPEAAAAAPDPVELPEPAPTDEPPLASRAPEAPSAPENAGEAEPEPAAAAAPEPVEVLAPAPTEPPPAPSVDPAYPVPAAEPAHSETPTPRRGWLPVTAVAVAVLLLAGATGWLGWQVRQDSVAEAGRPDAVAAARDAARLLFSYSHETLEADFAKGLAVTTGEFRSEYSRTTKEVVTPVAEQYDAVVVAEVVEASIIDAGPGRATALVFLNQGTTSTRVKGQQVDQSRVRMQLVERDGRWLVRAVDAL